MPHLLFVKKQTIFDNSENYYWNEAVVRTMDSSRLFVSKEGIYIQTSLLKGY